MRHKLVSSKGKQGNLLGWRVLARGFRACFGILEGCDIVCPSTVGSMSLCRQEWCFAIAGKEWRETEGGGGGLAFTRFSN